MDLIPSEPNVHWGNKPQETQCALHTRCLLFIDLTAKVTQGAALRPSAIAKRKINLDLEFCGTGRGLLVVVSWISVKSLLTC